MIALEVHDTKDFMNKLLLAPVFDHFCLIEATIATSHTVTIDGRSNHSYYSEEEWKDCLPFITWEKIRPFCFQLMKGSRPPSGFRITLTLSPKNIENVLLSSRIRLKAEQVNGLLLNIKYDGQKIICTTGTSLTIFTMDQQLNQEWDSLAEKFLKKNKIISTHV